MGALGQVIFGGGELPYAFFPGGEEGRSVALFGGGPFGGEGYQVCPALSVRL